VSGVGGEYGYENGYWWPNHWTQGAAGDRLSSTRPEASLGACDVDSGSSVTGSDALALEQYWTSTTATRLLISAVTTMPRMPQSTTMMSGHSATQQMDEHSCRRCAAMDLRASARSW